MYGSSLGTVHRITDGKVMKAYVSYQGCTQEYRCGYSINKVHCPVCGILRKPKVCTLQKNRLKDHIGLGLKHAYMKGILSL